MNKFKVTLAIKTALVTCVATAMFACTKSDQEKQVASSQVSNSVSVAKSPTTMELIQKALKTSYSADCLAYLEQASGEEDSASAMALAFAYEHGSCGKVDYEKSLRLYQRAVEKGNAVASVHAFNMALAFYIQNKDKKDRASEVGRLMPVVQKGIVDSTEGVFPIHAYAVWNRLLFDAQSGQEGRSLSSKDFADKRVKPGFIAAIDSPSVCDNVRDLKGYAQKERMLLTRLLVHDFLVYSVWGRGYLEQLVGDYHSFSIGRNIDSFAHTFIVGASFAQKSRLIAKDVKNLLTDEEEKEISISYADEIKRYHLTATMSCEYIKLFSGRPTILREELVKYTKSLNLRATEAVQKEIQEAEEQMNRSREQLENL